MRVAKKSEEKITTNSSIYPSMLVAGRVLLEVDTSAQDQLSITFPLSTAKR